MHNLSVMMQMMALASVQWSCNALLSSYVLHAGLFYMPVRV